MSFYERHGKRALDLGGALIALPVAAPVMGVVAGALWATQGRPILFRQARVGREGREFVIYKFRTMTVGAEQQGEGLWYVAGDRRITRLGGLLRSTSLDELPQLINVLKGDMGLVGPRPKPREIVDRYRSRYADTLRVRPGLTCLTATEGRNRLRRSEMIERDRRYVREVSLRRDLGILLRTVPVVVMRRDFQVEDRSEVYTEDVEPDPA
jgi:lipopolysaccharide/colanic/teichoic acid biosynthesis glycosyltransferase